VGLALLIAVICLPFVEIYVAIQVAHQIGGLATIALLVLLSLSGPWLLKHHGPAVWRRARDRVQAGEVPGRELTDGAFLLAAGVLLAVPGFLTAAVGLLLLLPPVRAVVRWASGHWFGRRARLASVSARAYSNGRWRVSTWGAAGGGMPTNEASAHDEPSSRTPLDGGGGQ
jgi:UPF0716 protein FxsA